MKYFAMAALVVIAGCAGSREVPELNQYLLRSGSSVTAAEDRVAAIGLGNVSVASYLDQPGIVLESGDGTIRPARYHEWAEPLRESLRGFLATEIAAASGQPVRHRRYADDSWKRRVPLLIDVHIDQLHGTASGEARLAASWTVTGNASAEPAAEHSFAATEALRNDGYAALIAAEERLLGRLAEAIAATLPAG